MTQKLRIASQLGAPLDEAVLRQAPNLPLEIVPLRRGSVKELPHGSEVLFAYPFHKAGEASAPRPDGWPFGVKWVQLMSAGTDAYPAWLFDGPVVTNASGTLAAPIAEFCLALILGAAKKLPQVWISRPEDWKLYSLNSVEGAALGIFGFGAIGENLARRALALGMKVYATRQSDRPMIPGVTRVDGIAELAALSDHLVLAAPATPETRHIVSTELLARAKPGLHLINVARGVLVDDEALLAAIESGQVSLASLDVTDPEPLPAGHPYYTHPRVRLSPHTSPMAKDADDRIASIFSTNLRHYLAGEPLVNVVAAKE